MEPILNIDLNDPRSEKIAEVLSNRTCKKILTLIAEKELTETEISQQLKIPLNTVDYNIKKLINSGLIETTNHFWSIKGKKMPSYKISEKKIIISPKSFSTNKVLLPLFSTALLAIYSFAKYLNFKKNIEIDSLAKTNAQDLFMASIVEETTKAVQPSFITTLSSLDWTLIGIWLGVMFFFLITKFSQGGQKKLKK